MNTNHFFEAASSLRRLRAAFMLLILATLSLVSCQSWPPQAHKKPEASPQFISASDGRFRYEGRFDFTNADAPVVIWQASRISIDFDGDTVSLRFDGTK